MNGKRPEGGYSGYRRFVYDRDTGTALIEPTAAKAASAAPAAGCEKPFAYQTVDERLICARAPAESEEILQRQRFDGLWGRGCA